MSDGMSDARYYGPSLSKHGAPIVSLEGKPLVWDESPKGCYSPHPLTRSICQLPPDGHKVHKRLHPNGVELETWGG